MRLTAVVAVGLVAATSAADVANDSPERQRLDACVARAIVAFSYNFDHPEIPTNVQFVLHLKRLCSREIDAFQTLLKGAGHPAETGSIISEAYDSRLSSSFHDILSATRRRLSRREPIKAGEVRLSRFARSAGFASPSNLSPGEILVISRQDAIGYGVTAFWRGTLQEYDYSYNLNWKSRWLGLIARAGDEYASVLCERDQGCGVSILQPGADWPRPIVELHGDGDPLRVSSICHPIIVAPAMASAEERFVVPQARQVSLTLADGTQIAFPDGTRCLDDDGVLTQRLLASPTLHLRYVLPGAVTPTELDGGTASAAAALRLAGYLASVTSREEEAAPLLRAASEAAERVSPFTLKDALSLSPEWRGALQCFVDGDPARPPILLAGEGGRCLHWIKSLGWRAEQLYLQFPAGAYDEKAIRDGKQERRRRSEALIRAEAAHLLQAGEPHSEPEQTFSQFEEATSVRGTPGRRGWDGAVEYAYSISPGRAYAYLPGNFTISRQRGVVERTTSIECTSSKACTVVLPVHGTSGALLVETIGSHFGSRLCLSGLERLRDWTTRIGDRLIRFGGDGCIDGDGGAALDSLISMWGLGLQRRGSTSHWVGGAQTDVAIALAGFLSRRISVP